MTYKPSSIALELFHQIRIKQQIFERIRDKYFSLNSELSDIASAICNFSQYRKGDYLICTEDLEPKGNNGPFAKGHIWFVDNVDLIRPKVDSLSPEFTYHIMIVVAQDQVGNLLTGTYDEYISPDVQKHFKKPSIKELMEFKKTLKVKKVKQ